MAIEIKNINKSFHGRGLDHDIKVLDDVNLNIEDGEFVCLLGPSGCGKTTLLRLIAGLDQPTSGEVIADGEVVKKPSGDRAVIFQQYSLFPWLTVLENVMFGLNLKKDRTKEENLKAAERYLESVGLIDFKDSYPHELSGGMKQRANFLRTFINSNDLMLLDEPFGALDSITKTNMQKWLLNVREKFNSTIILITHDIEEAITLSDRIYLISQKPSSIKAEFILEDKHKYEFGSSDYIKLKKDIISLL